MGIYIHIIVGICSDEIGAISNGMKTTIFNKLTLWSLYSLLFLLPIFYLPFTAEFLEINKQFLMYMIVIVALVSWLLGSIFSREMSLTRTPLEIPLGLLLLVTAVSALLSVDRRISLWGNYQSLSYGLVPLLFYVLTFILILNNINTVERIKKVITLLSASGLVAGGYFLLHAFKVLPLAKLAAWMPAWNLVSGTNSIFGLFMVSIFCVSLTFLMLKSTTLRGMIFYGLTALVALAAVLMIGFKTVWLLMVVGAFLLLVLAISLLEHMRLPWVSVTFGVFVMAVLFSVLGTPKPFLANIPTEVSLSHSISWDISTAALGDNLKQFLFGSGPMTFFYDFAKYRPAIFNQNFLWSARFNHSFSAIMDLLATTGLLGILAHFVIILLVLGVLFMIWLSTAHLKIKRSRLSTSLMGEETHRNLDKNDINLFGIFISVTLVWLLLVIASFVSGYSTINWFLFFTLLALIFTTGHLMKAVPLTTTKIPLKVSPQYTLVTSFVFILLFTGLILISIFIGRFYTAEVKFALAAREASQGNLTKVVEYLGQALKLNKERAKFHLELSSAYITRGALELQSLRPDQNVVSSALGGAVDEAKLATMLSPNNVETWEFLANMYAQAQSLAPEANRFRIQALEQAITLDPNNPSLYLSMAQAKLVAQDVEAAQKAVAEALRLKSDFASAYYLRGTLNEQTRNINGAIEDLATALSLASRDPVVAFNLGRLYYNRASGDDLVRAEQLFMYAIQLNPNYADAIWSLGLLYERKGATSQALELYRKVLRLNPDNRTVQDKVNALGG